jgi:hypothetical protein
MPSDQTIWTQAGTAILEALNADGSPAEAWRARYEAIEEDVIAFNLFPTMIDVKQGDAAHDSVSIDATFVVRGYVSARNEVDVQADPLVLWAWRAIRRDPTLGQLVSDVYIDKIEHGYVDQSVSDQVCVDITIRVEVEVDRNDPSVNKTYLS